MCGPTRSVSPLHIRLHTVEKIEHPAVIVRGYGTVVSVVEIHNLSFLTHPSLILVGVNNHRQFVIFVTTLVLGIALFDYLSYACTFLFPTALRASHHDMLQTSQRSQSRPTHPATYPLRAYSLHRCVTQSPTIPSYLLSFSGPRYSFRGQ